MFRLKAVIYTSAILLLISCNNDALDQCKNENYSLIAEKAIQDSVFGSITRIYGEIDSTSMVIAQKKSTINELAKKGRLSKEDKQFILAEMDSINSLMNENRNRVSSLQGQIDNQGLEEGFMYMVQSMDEKNTNEDLQLNDMKQDLAQVSRDFSDLFEDYVYKEVENLEMKEQLSSQAKELEQAQQKLDDAKQLLHSGWYIIGTKEELIEKGLIDKKGFFDNKEVNEDFDKRQFKKIDIHEFKEVILETKKVEIVTTHPSESYDLLGMKKKVNKLVVTNPELFWSVSKFLIIEIED